MTNKTCCFFGHREVDNPEKIREKLFCEIEFLIKKGYDTFLLGSKSDFNALCKDVLTEIKKEYPFICRIYVRAEFPYIDEDYKEYLLQSYEDTYFPERIVGSGKAVYVERNYEMIDKSGACIVYYKEEYLSPKRKSGTEIAYKYAERKGKLIINIV